MTAMTLDPVCTRLADEAPPATRNLAEALLALEAHHADHGHYDDDLVADVLSHLDTGADDVARRERERYAAHLERTARNARDLAPGVPAGLRTAAAHLRRDLARYRPGDVTP